MVQRLAEAQVHLEVDEPQNAAQLAAGPVRLVLGLRSDVVPLQGEGDVAAQTVHIDPAQIDAVD